MRTRPSSAADDAPLLEVTDLRTSFRTERGRVRAVDGVSFTLRRGESLGIVGESGSGKSVLSRTIMGLLPDSAEVSGSVRFAGREILDLSPDQRRHLWGAEMSMVFQNPLNSLNPVMRIGRQITEPLRLHLGMDRSNAEQTAIRLLRDVHIPEPERRLRQYPHELSGGMRQRVMIAMALACGPTLLIADEPTTALDVTVQAQILQVVNEQRLDRNMSLVLVTHDLGVVAGHTDRVAVMYGGRLVELAPTASLFADMKMPYTRALVRSIPRLADPSHSRLEAIPGRPPDLVDVPAGCPFAPRCPEARDRCGTDRPDLVTVAGGEHHYACWYPLDGPEGGR
jgi:oligopeptide/dipeptide ABC transporter ATP-binding protein